MRERSLSLDVPQTLKSSEPFAVWQHAERSIGAVNLHAFANIGQELGVLRHALASRDLAAGSLVARRLFS